MKSSIFLTFLCFGWLTAPVFSQDEPIVLLNPSFEGTPAEGIINSGYFLNGWYDCGFPSETSPDVHPKEYSTFQVTKEAFDGKTYLGMVVRENDTWEMVSQKLSRSLQAGKCYEFSISLCRSEMYLSSTRDNSSIPKNFVTPARLRIWGGSSLCSRSEELLAESSLIVNSRWLVYSFRFEPKKNYSHILLEAFYKTPSPFPYNGNVLLDNASPIIPVPCTAVKPTPPSEPVAKVDKPKPPVVSPGPRNPDTTTQPKKSRILKELENPAKLTKGQTIRIDQLYFQADSANIINSSMPVLNEVYDFLASNTDVVVEIGGHTNGIPSDEYCDRLSTNRAKAIVDYLSEKGIPRKRLQYKGYGKRQPVDTNKTIVGRKKNQRVEIKILSVDG